MSTIQLTEGKISKGGQNPPNTSDRRPPPPKGSGGKDKPNDDGFYSGVWSAIQHLVIFHGEDSLAAMLAQEHGITKAWAIAQQKLTAFENARMNDFIRHDMKK